jgi:hypothetical protein
VEIEADNLEDAMAQLAESVQSPNFDWCQTMREMMVLELSVDDERILDDANGDGTMWPTALEEDGRVWEGDFLNNGEYDMDAMPSRVQALIGDDEGQAE